MIMPSRDNNATRGMGSKLRSKYNLAKNIGSTWGSSAQKEALAKAQEASAIARRKFNSTSDAVSGTAKTLYKSYESKRKSASDAASSIRTKLSTAISNARGSVSYRLNRDKTSGYKEARNAREMSKRAQSGPASVRNDRFATVGTTTLKSNYTQAGKSMQAGKTLQANKNANRSKSGPTGASTAKSAYSMGAGNTPRNQFISREIQAAVKKGATQASARRTAEAKWKNYQAQQRKNSRVKK
jgi:hypothetical protein